MFGHVCLFGSGCPLACLVMFKQTCLNKSGVNKLFWNVMVGITRSKVIFGWSQWKNTCWRAKESMNWYSVLAFRWSSKNRWIERNKTRHTWNNPTATRRSTSHRELTFTAQQSIFLLDALGTFGYLWHIADHSSNVTSQKKICTAFYNSSSLPVPWLVVH